MKMLQKTVQVTYKCGHTYRFRPGPKEDPKEVQAQVAEAALRKCPECIMPGLMRRQ